MSARRAGVGLVISTLLLLVSGCIYPPPKPLTGQDKNGLPLGSLTQADLKRHDESRLNYPNAKIFVVFGNDETPTMGSGRSSASVGGALTTNDSSDQVYAWYADWLKTHGWSRCLTSLASTQSSVNGYCRGLRERFYVAIDIPKFLAEALGRPVPADAKTVFEFHYVITPAPGASPVPDPTSP